MRLQPIVVTLSTMFIVQGITLLVMDKPGGMIPPSLGSLLVGDAIPGILPMPLVILAVLVALWRYLRSTRLGTAIYAIGSDGDAARSTGIRVPRVQFAVYVLANACYGLAGVFISAQTGAGDPLVGNPMLLQVFAAIVVGGTRLGGGRGSPLGSIIGAYVLMMVVNILLVLNVSAYYSTIAEGTILFLAVLSGALGRKAALATHLREIVTRLRARRQSMLPNQLGRTDRRLGFVAHAPRRAAVSTVGGAAALLGPPSREPALRFPGLCLLRDRRSGDPARARQCAVQLAVLQLADRALVVPRDPGARPGRGHPHRRARPVAAVVDRAVRHPSRRHGQGLGHGADLCLADGAGDRLSHRPRQRARDRLSRPLADRHDAGDQRHAAGPGAALQQRHAGRLCLAQPALGHDRASASA